MYRQYFRKRNNRFREQGLSKHQIVSSIRSMQFTTQAEPTPEVYVAKNSFNGFTLAEQLKKNILYKRYSAPTPIQDQAIPVILEGRDLIGIANTGTGKTAAFLIPLINKVINDPSQNVLIITPTRELANQISDELYGFTYGIPVSFVVCVGGANMGRQKDNLRRKPRFIVGTPGRLKDLVQTGNINLSEFNNVVLDEADRMVDMGFVHDIKFFISGLPQKRQSLFFSATIPPKAAEILRSFVHDAVTVSVKTGETVSNIKQEIITINGRATKLEKLQDLLSQKEFEKVLIFGRTKWGVQKLSNELIKRGFNAEAIHGNKNQSQRQRALDDFKSNRVSILLATDVVARGIDVRDISHVINYDLPGSYEDYIHRIGRTGRANKKGVALTFIEN